MKRSLNLLSIIALLTLFVLAPVSNTFAQSNKEQIEKKEKAEEKKKGGFFSWLFGGSSEKEEDPVQKQKSTYQKYSEEELDFEFINMAVAGNIDNLTQLLRLGANVNARNLQGRTALIEVSRKGKFEVAQWLILRGASVNAKDMYDGTALIYATQEGNRDIVNLLIQNGARKDIH